MMNIAVLSGGFSPERNVSLTSGALIANALRKRGHAVALLDLCLGGEGAFTLEPSDVPSVGSAAPDYEDIAAAVRARFGRVAPVAPGVIDVCRKADVTFLALHGGIGENGRLQALLDIEGIRYTGSSAVSAAVAMDKDLTKRLLRQAGLPTADWLAVPADMADADMAAAAAGFPLPCIIKPASSGSSVGVGFCHAPEELPAALKTAADAERTVGKGGKVLLEHLLHGRELTCGVLLDRALPVIEIIPHEGFYDYKNKYVAGMTTEVVPAEIPEDVAAETRRIALESHRTLGLGSYSRTDFIWDEKDGLQVLEVNTLPGMTPTSLIPQDAAAVGVDYETLCEMLAEDALKR